MNATLQAEVHLGQDYEANSRYVKNHLWNSVGRIFNDNEKLISEHHRFPRCHVDVEKLIVQQSLSDQKTPKPTSSPTLYPVWEK